MLYLLGKKVIKTENRNAVEVRMTLMDIINMHKQCLKFCYDSMYPIRPDLYEIEKYRREHCCSRPYQIQVLTTGFNASSLVIPNMLPFNFSEDYIRGEYDAFYWMLRLNDYSFALIMSKNTVLMIGTKRGYALGFMNEVENYRNMLGRDLEMYGTGM